MVFVARWLVTATSGSSAPRSHRRKAVLCPVALTAQRRAGPSMRSEQGNAHRPRREGGVGSFVL
ncbi:MAG: hypothetical protein OEV04_10395, partial [Nitrospira sp.]|nr:hypothetical protein [Nitrospira sp.]